MNPQATAAPTHRVSTACPMDCPDSCSLEAEVTEDRVVALHATSTNPATAGFMCSKMKLYPARVHGEDRILQPLVRVGEKGACQFEPTTWDDALTRVAATLADIRKRHGAEAILPYHYDGSNGVFAHDCIDEALWRSLGASQLERTLCAAPASEAGAAIYGKMAGVAFADYVHANLIVVWGGNISGSNIHLAPAIKAARDRGAKLVVLDPSKTGMARQADLHIPLWPGSDMAVALWMIGEMDRRGVTDHAFLARHTLNADRLLGRAQAWTLQAAADAARVAPELLTRFADLYATTNPAVIRIGWGHERNRNGDGAMAAILALPAIAGKFGVRGGGYTLSNSGAFRTRSDAMAGIPLPTPAPRKLNMSRLGDLLAPTFTPAVRALVVYDANPMVSTPDQNAVRHGLSRDDLFTVVLEQVFTDTCAWADVILPVPTFLEQHELHRSYGTMVLQSIKPVIPRVGDTRSNEEIFSDLAARLGFSGPAFDASPAALTARYVAACEALPADAARTLDRTGIVGLSFDGAPGPIQFVNNFPPTNGGRADLDPESWRARGLDVWAFQPDRESAGFPLALISPGTSRTINSILGDVVTDLLVCSLNPEDAARRGVFAGDRVRVWNALGEVEAVAAIDDSLRLGVVRVPKGAWLRNCPLGANANALISSDVTPISGGATYNDARVEVVRLG